MQFAVDTSFVIAVLRGSQHSPRLLNDVGFPFAVIGELRLGALGATKSQQRLAELDDLLSNARVLPATADTAWHYAEIRHQLKVSGSPLPDNDVWIAAICFQHRLNLLSLDHHFDRIEGLKVLRE